MATAMLFTLTGALGCVAGDDLREGGPAATPGAGAPAPGASAPEAPGVKPTLVRPPDQVPSQAPGQAGDANALPAKKTAVVTESVLPPSLTGVTASPPSPWAMGSTTLTATTNIDVGPTPYYIRIWDGEAGAYIATCGAGTTCSGSVTRPAIQMSWFDAVVVDSQGNQADSLLFPVSWHGSGVKLGQSATTLAPGGSATLTTTTDYNIGSSPFYVEIFDMTSGTLLNYCGFGTTCSATVSQTAATTHTYRACFSSFGATYPPPNLLECTENHFVTWSSSGVTVSLTAPATTYSTVTVTAVSSINVGPTPYYLQIYNIEGTRIAWCSTGTTCSTTFTPTQSGSHLVAFVAQSNPTPPPPLAQAESPIIQTVLLPQPIQ
jgi:protein tyrosine phosphatase (PTP) superfamily phosphohydrolase (DUF442 family)